MAPEQRRDAVDIDGVGGRVERVDERAGLREIRADVADPVEPQADEAAVAIHGELAGELAARPWWSLTMVSKREPTHFTGLPSTSRRASARSTRDTACERMPKPPPTSCAWRRMRSAGVPVIAAKFGSIIDMPCELACTS